MSRKVNYFEAQQRAPYDRREIVVSLNAAYVPMVLSRIETAKGRSWWIDSDEWEEGYRQLTLFQWELLEDMSQFIVNNIIALRGIDVSAARDPVTGVPLNPPVGSTLLDLYATQVEGGFNTAQWLASIDEQVEATANATTQGLLGDDGDIALLAQLLAII